MNAENGTFRTYNIYSISRLNERHKPELIASVFRKQSTAPWNLGFTKDAGVKLSEV